VHASCSVTVAPDRSRLPAQSAAALAGTFLTKNHHCWAITGALCKDHNAITIPKCGGTCSKPIIATILKTLLAGLHGVVVPPSKDV
jgi:hypothetical protein